MGELRELWQIRELAVQNTASPRKSIYYLLNHVILIKLVTKAFANFYH